MMSDSKRKALACLAGVAILTALIAAALPRLELKPGVPVPAWANGVIGPALAGDLPGPSISISTLWKAIISLFIFVAVVYNGYRLLRSAAWTWQDIGKSILSTITPLFVAAAILFILVSSIRSTIGFISEEPPPSIVAQSGPPLGPPPPGLIWAAGLVFAAMMVGLGLWFLLRPAGRAGSDRLTLQAEWALQALKRGLDLKNVIVRCYWEMGQVLREEQGIEMEAAMTVREFESLLVARGVPHPPVHQLTELFESVRYGRRTVSADDERRAVDCLTAIAQYSRAKQASHPA
jgi:hypothetical protein